MTTPITSHIIFRNKTNGTILSWKEVSYYKISEYVALKNIDIDNPVFKRFQLKIKQKNPGLLMFSINQVSTLSADFLVAIQILEGAIEYAFTCDPKFDFYMEYYAKGKKI